MSGILEQYVPYVSVTWASRKLHSGCKEVSCGTYQPIYVHTWFGPFGTKETNEKNLWHIFFIVVVVVVAVVGFDFSLFSWREAISRKTLK